MPTRRVAVVGGGVTGAAAASTLTGLGHEVHVFDQGRRGPGGRASHRSVRAADAAVLADDEPPPETATWEFDHGCQFFRADSERMRRLCAAWCERGWAAPYEGRFGKVGDAADFFGLPSEAAPVYAGVGGMQRLVRAMLRASAAQLHAGVRVSGMSQGAEGRWTLRGVGGEAAFHDAAEACAAASSERGLGDFDAVVLTDVSSSFEAWHRASAGVPEALAARVRERVRVPLFSCMVALHAPLDLPLDALSFGAAAGAPAPAVWWAARSQAKPGAVAGAGESWTLVSTPAFAAAEVRAVTMRDPDSGAFRPQTDEYLNGARGPARALLASFLEAVAPLLPPGADPPAEPAYLQAQRWGSAFPAPAHVGGRDGDGRGEGTASVLGVAYESATPPLVYARPAAPAASAAEDRDFLADDALKLVYAGDFCSRRPPGFEAACLSGVDAAEHLGRRLEGTPM